MGWIIKMMVHKAERKSKRTGLGYTVGMAGMVCAAAVYAWAGGFTLYVQAAPVTLTSSDATVYGEASEDSGPVGNLVEGSTFEYIGDITAEDGSTWYQITTATGVEGYIKGDREMEAIAEEPSPEGQEDPLEGSESPPAGNEAEDEGQGAGEAPEGDDSENSDSGQEEDGGEEGEVPEGSEDALEENDSPEALGIQNNQAKKYVLSSSGKIKERETSLDPGINFQNPERAGKGLDKALLAGIAVVLACAAAIQVCLTRLRLLAGNTDNGEIMVPGRGRNHRKPEKKRHSQKRRTKKAVQGRKESGKAPKEKSKDI